MSASNKQYYEKERIKEIYQSSHTSDIFGDFHEILLEEVKDIDIARMAYSVVPIIPFLEGADATLSFFRRTASYSSTHHACIRAKKNFIFGGEFEMIANKRAGFRRNDSDETKKEAKISDQDYDAFIDFIESLNPDFDGDVLLNEATLTFLNYDTYGNAFIRADFITVGSERRVQIYDVCAESCRYYATYPSEEKIVLISKSWELDYISKYKPVAVPLYPNVHEVEDGVFSTIIHIKNSAVNRDWYGLPTAMGSIFAQYTEMQLGKYSNQGYAEDWTGRVFFETVTDNSENNKGFLSNLRRVFSHKGKGRKVIHRNRMTNEEPTKVHEFNTDNKSWEFHKHETERAENQIVKSHQLNKYLLGQSQAGKLGASQEFIDIYETFYLNVIRPYQKKICSPYNKLLKLAGEFLGNKIMESYSLMLYNMYHDVMSAKKEVKNQDDGINNKEVDE